jgi:hypothetical protein
MIDVVAHALSTPLAGPFAFFAGRVRNVIERCQQEHPIH